MRFLLLLCASTLVIRLGVILWLPTGAYSLDLRHYLEIQVILDRAGNPYVETPYLNYGPFWLQILWLLRKVSDITGIPRDVAIKLFSVLLDTVSAGLIYAIGARFLPVRRAFVFVLLGFALNPVPVAITCIHGSFDSLVVLLILLGVHLLFRYQRSGQICNWIGACLALGYGVVAKTVPVLAVPMLLTDWIQKRREDLFLGGLIFFTPIAIGFSTIYTLFPVDVKAKVLAYASVPGYFGVTGIFRLLGGAHAWDEAYSSWFRFGLLALLFAEVLFLMFMGFKRSLRIPVEFLVLNFLVLVTLGPGYGPQYLSWICPLVLVQLLIVEGSARSVFYRPASIFFFVVATATVLYEYLHSPGLSGSLAWESVPISDYQVAQRVSTISRLPLFFAMLCLLGCQIRLTLELLRQK